MTTTDPAPADFELLGRDPEPSAHKIIHQRLEALEMFCLQHRGEWVVVPPDLTTHTDVGQWLQDRPNTIFDRWEVETDATTLAVVVKFSSCG